MLGKRMVKKVTSQEAIDQDHVQNQVVEAVHAAHHVESLVHVQLGLHPVLQINLELIRDHDRHHVLDQVVVAHHRDDLNQDRLHPDQTHVQQTNHVDLCLNVLPAHVLDLDQDQIRLAVVQIRHVVQNHVQ